MLEGTRTCKATREPPLVQCRSQQLLPGGNLQALRCTPSWDRKAQCRSGLRAPEVTSGGATSGKEAPPLALRRIKPDGNRQATASPCQCLY